MKEAFEKIIERLEESTNYTIMCGKHFTTVNRAIEIVNQVAEEYKDRDCSKCSRRSWYQIGYADAEKKLAEEYGTDINVGSNDGWIPCSERLPDYFDNVLVCTQSGGKTIASLLHSPIEWKDIHMYKIENVVAWMPLPSPYEPKKEE